MGFNDPLSFEHYKIILKNVSWSSLWNPGHVYDWLLLWMHMAGFAVLISRTPLARRLEFWFFIAQPLLFPFAIFGMPMVPLLAQRILAGTLNRKDISNIPFVWCTAHPVWVATSLVIALCLRGAVLRWAWTSSRGQISNEVGAPA